MEVWILTKTKNPQGPNYISFRASAKRKGIDLRFVNSEDFTFITPNRLLYNGEEAKLPDCVIPRMSLKINYFGQALIRFLRRNGVFVLNTAKSIEVASDKIMSALLLQRRDVPMAKTFFKQDWIGVSEIEKEMEYPMVVKWASGQKGTGVYLCQTRGDLKDILRDSFEPVLIQEFISESKGKNVRVYVVGNKVIGAIQNISTGFKTNLGAEASSKAFELNAEGEKIALAAKRATGLEVAGVDLLFKDDSFVVSEIDATPGFEKLRATTGISFPDEVFDYIKERLKKKEYSYREK